MTARLAAVALLTVALLPSTVEAREDCQSHYSTYYQLTITRCRSHREAFRALYPCPSTGRTRGRCPGYVIDHIVPLKRGGLDDPSNMQWQTVAAARAKDRWE